MPGGTYRSIFGIPDKRLRLWDRDEENAVGLSRTGQAALGWLDGGLASCRIIRLLTVVRQQP